MKTSIVCSLALLGAFTGAIARADAQGQAIRLFDRLAGVPIKLDDPRLAQMTGMIASGDLRGAAQIATSDDAFYNITVKHFAAPLSNRNEDSLVPLNDLIATVIGVIRDGRDARELLSGNVIYQGNPATVTGRNPATGKSVQANTELLVGNNHYQLMDDWRTNLRQHLVAVPQRGYAGEVFIRDGQGNPIGENSPITLPDTAGVLTSRQWAQAHLAMGTNRRAIEYAFKEFLCAPNTTTRDTTVSDDRVRQDVSRAPGGNPTTYQVSCRGCHAAGDALAGAYAYFENGDPGQNDFLIYQAGNVQTKMVKNSDVFPGGYVTTDDSWINKYNRNQNVLLGWDSNVPQQGNGIAGVGRMLANSQAFARCMAKRVFTEVCRRAPDGAESSQVQSLAQDFASGGYKLKGLFEAAAIFPACLGN